MEVYPEKNFSRAVVSYNLVTDFPIKCGKDKINMLCIEITFKLYDIETRKEVLFNNFYQNEIIGVEKAINKKGILVKREIRLADCLDVYIDEKEMYKIVVKEKLLLKLGYYLEYKITNFYKFCDNIDSKINGDIEISHSKLLKTIKDNMENFLKAKEFIDEDIKLNLPVQSKTYYKKEIKNISDKIVGLLF